MESEPLGRNTSKSTNSVYQSRFYHLLTGIVKAAYLEAMAETLLHTLCRKLKHITSLPGNSDQVHLHLPSTKYCCKSARQPLFAGRPCVEGSKWEAILTCFASLLTFQLKWSGFKLGVRDTQEHWVWNWWLLSGSWTTKEVLQDGGMLGAIFLHSTLQFIGCQLEGRWKRGVCYPQGWHQQEKKGTTWFIQLVCKSPLGLQRGFVWPLRSSCEEHLSMGLGRKQKKSHFLSNLIYPVFWESDLIRPRV